MHRRLMIGLVAVGGALLFATGAVAALLIASDDSDNDTTRAGVAVSVAGTGKGYLGLTVTANPQQSLRVATVVAEGPAAKAGILVGDFIRSVDGQVVRTPEQLRTAVESKAPGTQVKVTYERGDQESQASVKLGDAPPNASIEATPAPSAQQQPNRPNVQGMAGRGQLGVTVQNITPELKARLNLTRDSGAVVVQVLPNSPAAAAGLRTGDIIAAVGGRPVATADDLTRMINAATGQVTLSVLRGGDTLTIQANLASAQAIPGLESLPQVLQERLREIMQLRGLSADQLRMLAAGQNNLTLGTVKSMTASALTLTRDGGGDVTYTLNDQTQYRRGADTIAATEIRTGTTVMVISLDGQSAIGVFAYQR